MKYLKSAASSNKGFTAKFSNGESTRSHSVACFFMAMQDKDAEPDELADYIPDRSHG